MHDECFSFLRQKGPTTMHVLREASKSVHPNKMVACDRVCRGDHPGNIHTQDK
jgi:hypothetical protein